MQPWSGQDYGNDQFSASYDDPYFDMNELKYNTRPSETIQMSTPVNLHIKTRDTRQQANALKCEETMLQMRNNNDNMLEMYKKLQKNNFDKTESFVKDNLQEKQTNKIIMYLLLFIVILIAVLLIQIQNINSKIDTLAELSKLILYMKKV
jgi:hypothetical protein